MGDSPMMRSTDWIAVAAVRVTERPAVARSTDWTLMAVVEDEAIVKSTGCMAVGAVRVTERPAVARSTDWTPMAVVGDAAIARSTGRLLVAVVGGHEAVPMIAAVAGWRSALRVERVGLKVEEAEDEGYEMLATGG